MKAPVLDGFRVRSFRAFLRFFRVQRCSTSIVFRMYRCFGAQLFWKDLSLGGSAIIKLHLGQELESGDSGFQVGQGEGYSSICQLTSSV